MFMLIAPSFNRVLFYGISNLSNPMEISPVSLTFLILAIIGEFFLQKDYIYFSDVNCDNIKSNASFFILLSFDEISNDYVSLH